MAVVYVAPPVATVAGLVLGDWPAAFLGAAAWQLMAAAYAPTLRLYGQGAFTAFLLPAAALLYEVMTIDSAVRYWRGRGGAWKGRTYGTA